MERLKRLRQEKGLSQARLAARAELDPSTVNQIERGARDASPGTLRKLADALGVSLFDLLEEEAPKAPAPSLESASATALSEDEQRGLALLYRELVRRFRAVERSLRSEEQPDFEELRKLDYAHAVLAKKRGKRDILGKDLDELAEAQDDLLLVHEGISRLIDQMLVGDLDEKQRAEVEDFKRRHARAFKTQEQAPESATA
jgi:transcriptional regulator with XRE-family HTH domain